MIKGRIAIPSVDPKTWRAKGRKRKQPALASAIVTPAPMKKRLTPKTSAATTFKSAIVEPKRKPTMLAHLLEDITPEERERRADMIVEMFREICRRAALPE
jgi:hypothetical protein